jgi:putative nucleotidyltransferase with HDIG domain
MNEIADFFMGTPTGFRLAPGAVTADTLATELARALVSRLDAEHGPRLAPPESPQSRSEESERVVIARLIRRLRISDPPQQFQTVATTVLRWSLNMAAVAWVPRTEAEPVVWSGEVPGLDGESYRTLPAPAGRESLFVFNGTGTESSIVVPPSVRRFALVATGSLGCLVAVNPLADRPIDKTDVERLQFVASLIATQLSNVKIYSDLKGLLFGIIRGLTTAIDAKDTYTSGHSERVARIAVRLGHELGLPPAKLSDLYLAGLLHDVGKIGVDDVVLKKCGPLTPEEHKKIQSHVEIGVTILKDLKMLHHILPAVRHHHESWDGSGYPDKLAGDGIPFEARILAVADAYDVMANNRPYRNRLGLAQIDRILKEGRAVQWDPQVIDALHGSRSDLEAIAVMGVGEELIGAVDLELEHRFQGDVELAVAPQTVSGSAGPGGIGMEVDAQQASHAEQRRTQPDSTSPAQRVLEEFQGFIESIEGDAANVTLENERGERLYGPFPAKDLTEKGLAEGSRFVLRTIDEGEVVRITITQVDSRSFGPREIQEIRREVERDLQGYSTEDDY